MNLDKFRCGPRPVMGSLLSILNRSEPPPPNPTLITPPRSALKESSPPYPSPSSFEPSPSPEKLCKPLQSKGSTQRKPSKLSSTITPPPKTSKPKPWKDLLHSPGHPELPLRLLIVGHNPSTKSYNYGHYYANPSNHFYRMLISAKLIPPGLDSNYDTTFPINYGIGFTDLWQVEGSDSRNVQRDFKKGNWRDAFYQRLIDHEKRAGGRPKVVAFTGKGIFGALLGVNKRINHGLQERRPECWPWGTDVAVWVLASPSGRAGMTNEKRVAPYLELAKFLKDNNFQWVVSRKRKHESVENIDSKRHKESSNQEL